MNIYLIVLLLLVIIGSKIYIKKFNPNYIDKTCTTCLNGFFVLIVLYSHFSTYVDVIYSKDFLMVNFKNLLGQLMVTSFLFYSGYGIYYQIKNKKDKYINNMPVNRILKTWIKFFIGVLSFLVVDLIIKEPLTVKKILLSFIGWDSLGNSNWYIFGIIFMYLFTFVAFKVFKDHNKAILINSIFIILFIILLSFFKEDHWFNTLLCYLFGMLYCYNKDKIDKHLLNHNIKYIITGILVFIAFILLYKYSYISYWLYEIYASLFMLLVVLMTYKIDIKNKILYWCGTKLFWIYILQRIPMIVFKEIGLNKHIYIYFILVLVTTIILSFIYSLVFDRLIDKLVNKKAR